MLIGFFHPSLNGCGGAEWVVVNMINSLATEGHEIVVLTNQKIDYDKIGKIFGCKVNINKEIVFPFEPFPVTDLHNVYTDAIRTLLLKSKCDILLDIYSNAILPGANITYIHFPLLGRLRHYSIDGFRSAYYIPYLLYEKRAAKNNKRLILANSKYTANAVRNAIGTKPFVLYPPISEEFYSNFQDTNDREDLVVTVSRISPEKNLTLIPSIAKVTNRKIHFLIIGIMQSSEELNRIFKQIEINKVSDRVEVITNVSREDLLNVLRNAKIFLHPAHKEHFGVAIVEAMASGCIPIVHNSGGPREFVPSLFRFDTLEEAAKKIEREIFGWKPKKAKLFNRLAQPFCNKKFIEIFLNIFRAYIQNTVHYR